jgi:predicted DCC family thiol-disulfide oxidoreductase YuxK
MPELPNPAYSYRDDPAVPAFDDARPLFLFDGICVMCSSGAGLIMRRDKQGRINLASAQSALGAALYRHYGLALDQSYLLIKDGRAFTKSAGFAELFTALGGWWRLLKAWSVVPERWRDWLYDRVAPNRYRWFGKADHCALLSEAQRKRLLSDG